MRNNLITVPSCDKHNSEKSKDDEYFRAIILLATAHNSPVASDQFLGKLLRAASRKPIAYSSFLDEKGKVEEGTFRALQLDRNRFDGCVDHLVRAIYFYKTGDIWPLPISTTSPNLFSGIENGKMQLHKPTVDLVEMSRQYLIDEPIEGNNPEVFKYRIHHENDIDTLVFGAIFYETFEIFSYSSKSLPHNS